MQKLSLMMLMLMALGGCFAPETGTASGGASCVGSEDLLYGSWKLVRGYPAASSTPALDAWRFGSNPTEDVLKFDFRVLMIQKGEDACVVQYDNQAMQTPPVARIKYVHNSQDKVLGMRVNQEWTEKIKEGETTREYNFRTVNSPALQSLKYSFAKCNTATPELTLTNVFTGAVGVYRRHSNGGLCNNN